MPQEWQSTLQLVTVLILFVIVIAMAYFVSKWLAGYQKAKNFGANVEVIESCRIAPSKFISIIRVGEKYLAISVGKDEIHVLTELDKDDIIIHAPGETGGKGFSGLIGRLKPGGKDRGNN